MQKVYKKLRNGLTALYRNRPIRLNNNKTLTANRLCLSCVTAHRREYTNTRQKSRAVARKPRDAAAVLFRLKFADDITSLRVPELRKH